MLFYVIAATWHKVNMVSDQIGYIISCVLAGTASNPCLSRKKVKPLLTGDNPMSDRYPSADGSIPVPSHELS